MTADEALKAILGKIDAPEELDEEINVITEFIRSGANVTDDGYKERYEGLREKYIARFGEMLAGQETPKADIEEPKADVGVVEDVTPEMLDFDGSTE
mgnify:FL=1|jgi:hypothetical protein|nr:MAG TPA: hypothetical protein [Caudoviricetes sp.]